MNKVDATACFRATRNLIGLVLSQLDSLLVVVAEVERLAAALVNATAAPERRSTAASATIEILSHRL
jgi:hypothetical protein